MSLILQWYKTTHRFFKKTGIKSPLLSRINNFFISYLKSEFVEVSGHKMYLDSTDDLRLSTRGFYEPYLVNVATNEIKEGDTVVDIGANIGYHTLLFARKVGQKGRVFAFEPHPDNFLLLTKNIHINKYTNIIPVQKAVSNTPGRLRLYLDEDSSTRHSLLGKQKDSEKFVEVESVDLDNFFKTEKIDFIKIDIEGAEFYALQGMLSVIKKNPSIKIITEFTPKFLKSNDINPNEYITLLTKAGFSLYNIDETEKKLEPFRIELFSKYLAKKHCGAVNINLLCVKEPSKRTA